jgi:hypothetical protein
VLATDSIVEARFVRGDAVFTPADARLEGRTLGAVVVVREVVEAELGGLFGGVLPNVVLLPFSAPGSTLAARAASEDVVPEVAVVDRARRRASTPSGFETVGDDFALTELRTEGANGRVGVLAATVGFAVVLVRDPRVPARDVACDAAVGLVAAVNLVETVGVDFLASPPAAGVTIVISGLLASYVLASTALCEAALLRSECDLSGCQAYSHDCVSRGGRCVISTD